MPLPRFLSNWLHTTNWENLSVHVDITLPDQRINLMPKRRSELPDLAFGIGMPVIAIYEVINNLDDNVTLAFSAVFIVGGIGLFAMSLISLLSKREAVFGNDAVNVSGNNVFGNENWKEPYNRYNGVLHREKSVSKGQDSPTILYQIIELQHDDPTKNIPLMVEKSGTMPRDDWEAYAKWLHLPAITTIEGETTTRDLEDLDKSVAELAAEGKIATRLDFSDAPVPKGLQVAKEIIDGEECLRVNITVPRAHIAARLLVCGIPILFFLIIAVIGIAGDSTWMTVLGVSAIILISGLGIMWSKRDNGARRDILITRTKMVMTDPWAEFPHKSLKLNEIETVALQSRGGGIMIAGDEAQTDIGAGLSKEALLWLKDYLTSAIATA